MNGLKLVFLCIAMNNMLVKSHQVQLGLYESDQTFALL